MLTQNLEMQNTKSPENLDLSAKSILGPSNYTQQVHTVPSPSQPHGYGDSGLETQISHLHPSPAILPSDMMQRGNSSTSEELGPVSGNSNVSSMAAQGLIGQDPDDPAPDGRKAKRELSQSKRAAQNRAAQRAFRQRKEHYIKKLEQQVKDSSELENAYKAVQSDNYALREYIIQLQSRLLDLQVELPQPPPNVTLNPPGAPGAARQAPLPVPSISSEPHPNSSTSGTLADVAAAVAGLRREPPVPEGVNHTRPTTFKPDNMDHSQQSDEIRRQHQADGLPLPPSTTLRT